MSLADLLVVQTEAQALTTLSSQLAHNGIPPKGWSRNSVHYALLDLFSRADAAFTSRRAAVARACARNLIMQIADTVTRDAWLDVFALGFYDLTRFPARAATHAFRVTASAAASPIDLVPRARVVTTEDGIQFRNTGRLASDTAADPATIRVSPGTSVDLEFEAVVPGEDGNIAANETITFVQAIAGFSVANPPYAGGTSILTRGLAAELSESLNQRCSGRWDRTAVAQLPGAIGEWIHEAFTSTGATSPIIKWVIDDANPNGPGSVDVYVAESGSTTAATLATIDAYIQPRRSLGAGTYRVLAPDDVEVLPSVHLYTYGRSSTNIADVSTAIELLELLEPLGGTFFASDIIQAARSVSDVYDVTTDFETLTLAPHQRLRLTPDITEN